MKPERGITRYVTGLLIMICCVSSMVVSGQQSQIDAPADQSIAYQADNRNINLTLDKSTTWGVKANKVNNALVTFEGPSFTHVRDAQYKRPTRLELSKKSGGGKWKVISSRSSDTSSGNSPAVVQAKKRGRGGGKALFDLKVTFIDENSRIPPEGQMDMTVTSTISSGN